VIESGTAEVRQDGNVIRTVGPGDVFGEIGILATGSRTAFVVATSPVRLAALYIREFKQLERRMPQLTRALPQAMAARRPRPTASALGWPRLRASAAAASAVPRQATTWSGRISASGAS